MKVISFTATLPRKENATDASLRKSQDKLNTLNFFVEGVNCTGDQGLIVTEMEYQPCDVAVILGWVHEHGKTAPHLEFRRQILEQQQARGCRTIIADSNLFLYKDTSNPEYWLRYSYDGIFPNTGEYCDTPADPERWQKVQKHLGIQLKPWRNSGNHILLCLQRDGGWSMGGMDVVEWALRTIETVRQYSKRSIRIRTHPGDKRASKYADRIIKLCMGRQLGPVSLSQAGTGFEQDLQDCWAVINHNSSPGVAAAIEGIPVFVTDPVHSQAKEVANTDLSLIENPTMFDRQAWIERISQFHWSHQEVRDGTCWTHMKKWAKK